MSMVYVIDKIFRRLTTVSPSAILSLYQCHLSASTFSTISGRTTSAVLIPIVSMSELFFSEVSVLSYTKLHQLQVIVKSASVSSQ